jgi:hypothetical protein
VSYPVPSRELLSRTSLLGIWILVAALFAIIEPHSFLQSGTFKTIFGSQFELVLLAAALICTFVVGEFDLSITASMGLAGTLVPLLAVQDGFPVVVATICALLASAAVGVINGILVVVLGVDAIVATLGMSTFVLGVTLWATNLNAVNGLSASYSELALRNILGLPIAFWYGAIVCLILTYVLTMTPLGRRMSFVGSSREVARLAGINVNRILRRRRPDSRNRGRAAGGEPGRLRSQHVEQLPAAGVRLGVPRHSGHPAGQVQRDRGVRRGVLPPDRDRRSGAARPDGLDRGRLLRRLARDRRRRDDHHPQTNCHLIARWRVLPQ